MSAENPVLKQDRRGHPEEGWPFRNRRDRREPVLYPAWMYVLEMISADDSRSVWN